MVCEKLESKLKVIQTWCLNPCFNGRWSASWLKMNKEIIMKKVLILVLMEDGLREFAEVTFKLPILCLNPCFNGRWSARGKIATRRFADL